MGISRVAKSVNSFKSVEHHVPSFRNDYLRV